MNTRHRNRQIAPLLVLGALLLGGCLDESGDGAGRSSGFFAATATVAPDFSSGAHALLGLDDDGALVAHNDIAPTHSDVTIAGHAGRVYRIERFQGANVTRFDGNLDVTTVHWQYSVTEGDSAAATNPQNMIVASDSKAYIPIYGKDKVLIVNPGAASEAQFITGALDLSAYADGDGVPEVHNGVIADGKLFLTLQRLSVFVPDNVSYLAVFDIATDQEIDTGQDPLLNGIPLTIRNPDNDIVYVEAERAVYVQAVGKNFDFDGSPEAFTGGIERIDVDDYATRVVVFDDPVRGHTNAMAIASSARGYLVGGDFLSNTVYAFDPVSGAVGAAVNPALTGIQIADISMGPDGYLWVSDTSNATIHRLDPGDDSIVDAVVTNLNPTQVAFFATP